MKIETHEISYFTADPHGGQLHPVAGEALNLPAPWADLRLCVRKMNPLEQLFHYVPRRRQQRYWRIDHYSTGCNIDRRVAPRVTRSAAITALVKWLATAPECDLRLLRADNLAEGQRILRETSLSPWVGE